MPKAVSYSAMPSPAPASGKNTLGKIVADMKPNSAKSYHSIDVPINVAPSTLKTPVFLAAGAGGEGGANGPASQGDAL